MNRENHQELHLSVTLNPTELEILFRQAPHTKNDGGWQQLLVALESRTNKTTGALTLTPAILDRIQRYAFDYGNGGWETRLRGIFERNLGAQLGRQTVLS
jgi:hypothetical protein